MTAGHIARGLGDRERKPEGAFNPYRQFDGIVVPLGLLKDRTLSAGAKLLLGRLLRYAGKNGRCNPSVSRLADDLGVTGRSIRRELGELERAFIIKRHGHGGAPGSSSDFEFLAYSPWPNGRVTKTSPVTRASSLRVTLASERGDENVTQREVVRRIIIKEKNKEVRLRSDSPVICGKASEPQNLSSSLSLDDDDLAPSAKLRRYIGRKHPDLAATEVSRIVQCICHDLEARCSELTADCVEYIKRNSNGKCILNPAGLYRKKAREYAGDKHAAEALRQMELRDALLHGIEGPAFKPSCEVCNDGLMEGGGLCSCKVGDLRRQMAERVSRDDAGGEEATA